MSTSLHHLPSYEIDIDLDSIFAMSDWVPHPTDDRQYALRIWLKEREKPFLLSYYDKHVSAGGGTPQSKEIEAAFRDNLRADLFAAWQQRKLQNERP